MIKRSVLLLLLMLLVSGAILLLTERPLPATPAPACGNRSKPTRTTAPRMHWNFLTSALFPAES